MRHRHYVCELLANTFFIRRSLLLFTDFIQYEMCIVFLAYDCIFLILNRNESFENVLSFRIQCIKLHFLCFDDTICQLNTMISFAIECFRMI